MGRLQVLFYKQDEVRWQCACTKSTKRNILVPKPAPWRRSDTSGLLKTVFIHRQRWGKLLRSADILTCLSSNASGTAAHTSATDSLSHAKYVLEPNAPFNLSNSVARRFSSSLLLWPSIRPSDPKTLLSASGHKPDSRSKRQSKTSARSRSEDDPAAGLASRPEGDPDSLKAAAAGEDKLRPSANTSLGS